MADTRAPPTRRLSTGPLLAAAVLSGAAALAYELVWFRECARFFGIAVHAVGAVVAAFFSGLALGSYWAGARLAPRATGLRLALLEGAAALVGLAWPPLFVLLDPFLVPPPGEGFSFAAASWTFLLIAPPAALLGATFPVLARLLVRGEETAAARRVGAAYALNTLGGAAGLAAATLLLLPRLGLSGTSRAAALANLAAALLCAFAARAPRCGSASGGRPHDRTPAPLLVASFLAGAGMLAFEVLGARILLAYSGQTVFAFAAVLGVFLVGTAIGGFLAGPLAKGRAARRHIALSVALLPLLAAAGAGLLRLVTETDPFAGPLNAPAGAPEVPGVRAAALAALLFGPATVASGAWLPAAVREFSLERIGGGVGRLWAANIAGGLFGSLLVPALGLPALGLRGTFLCVCALLAAASIPLLFGGWIAPRTLAALLVFASFGLWLAGREGRDPAAALGAETVFHRESPAASVTVVRVREADEPEPVLSLFVNGKPVASTVFVDRRLQLLLGTLPHAATGGPRAALSIGLGTGMSSGALAVRSLRTDVVELVSGVVEAARRFERWNAALLDRPDVRVLVDDGRAFLRRTRRRYGVASTDPIHPWVAGSSSLFTEEYYRALARHLEPDGLVAQWIPLYQLGAEEIGGILRSLLRSFPEAGGFVTGYDLVVLASRRPIRLDPAAIDAALADPDLAPLLEGVAVTAPPHLAATYFAGTRTLARLAARATRPLTDDLPWIEWSAARRVGAGYALEVIRLLAECDDPIPWLAGTERNLRRESRAANETLRRAALEFVEKAQKGDYAGARRALSARIRSLARPQAVQRAAPNGR